VELCQPGVMNKSWMDIADLFVASTISNQPVAGYIIVCSRRERVLVGNGALIVNEPWVRFFYFGWEQPIFLTCVLLLCHLTYLTNGTKTFNILCKTRLSYHRLWIKKIIVNLTNDMIISFTTWTIQSINKLVDYEMYLCTGIRDVPYCKYK
jgi:hypothetical protein